MVSTPGRVRVLHLCAGNLYGGIEKLLLTFAAERHLCPEMEPEFTICFEGRLADELRATGAPVHMLGNVRLSRPWTTWRARGRLKDLARAQFDLVIAHGCWLHAAFGSAVKQIDLPLWFWAHDAYVKLGRIDRAAARIKPDHIIANSQFTLRNVPNVFPGVPGEVLHYPLPFPPAMDRSAIKPEVRKTIDCAEQKTVIFMAARLEEWKGHTLLLEALARLKEGDWQAWIAGAPQRPHEQEYYAKLQEMAQRLGIDKMVRWLGQRKDVARLLAAADIHCQPNTGPEPFGIVFIEAMQAGLPVVTTRMGAAPEIVDETCGVLVPPGDPQGLAEALDAMMQPQHRDLFSGGVAKARALCDPAQQLRRLFDAACKHGYQDGASQIA